MKTPNGWVDVFKRGGVCAEDGKVCMINGKAWARIVVCGMLLMAVSVARCSCALRGILEPGFFSGNIQFDLRLN